MEMSTPVGPLQALADDARLYKLLFPLSESTALEEISDSLQGRTKLFQHLEDELSAYFSGTGQSFTIPLAPEGTDFQQDVWRRLQTIPFGTTWSYGDIAKTLGRPSAYRAVAQAIGRNPVHLIIPCHRVIYGSGGLGGFAAGIRRKQWLLEHEGASLNG
jgi:methylated-DNA-[protein]-cysteine S-methyltransferase